MDILTLLIDKFTPDTAFTVTFLLFSIALILFVYKVLWPWYGEQKRRELEFEQAQYQQLFNLLEWLIRHITSGKDKP